jgi:methylenetetrahydrofolate reductase (NADPH)
VAATPVRALRIPAEELRSSAAAEPPFADALRTGRFCYVVELVASALKREAQVLEVASRLAGVPDVVAGSITSYAGGGIGHDPIRVGTAARARGLTPNVHLTCVSEDRDGLRKTLEDLSALGIDNVFALTGDFPKTPDPARPPVFDLDSVHLVRLIAELRRAGRPFHVAVAVSPFKYVEADCRYQYLKLEKKAAAGADCAITQVGWDSRKFRELITYCRERGITMPLLGNVYVLGARAAEKMAGGEPPGCWVSPELLARVREESTARDKGLGARLERAAHVVAVLRGLGYAGAYIGGTHDAEQVAWIIRRGEELAPRWEELARELEFGADGFYMYAAQPPKRSQPAGRLVPRVLNTLGRLFPVTRDTWLRRALRAVARWVDRRPALAAAVERFELLVKRPMFGCQACGNCVLGHMEYVCPQTCPKQMRNGPCGGTHFGRCEVVDQPCIWVGVMERARAAHRDDELRVYIPPPNRQLQGTSSWINYLLDRDSRPGALSNSARATESPSAVSRPGASP